VTELRAKTDRQLQTIIRRRLEGGLALARRSAYDEAHDALAEVRRLLPVVNLVPDTERRLLNLRLEQLARLLAAEDDWYMAATG